MRLFVCSFCLICTFYAHSITPINWEELRSQDIFDEEEGPAQWEEGTNPYGEWDRNDYNDDDDPFNEDGEGDDELQELTTKGEERQEESQTHLDVEPTSIVNGSVNVITGSFQSGETDFSLVGAAGFSFQRAYVSTDIPEKTPFGKGWSPNYFSVLDRWENKHSLTRYRASILEGCGAYHTYHSQRKHEYEIDFSSYCDGVTNCGSGMISSRTNIANNKLHYRPSNMCCYLEKPCGSSLVFAKRKHHHLWNVIIENLPNGNRYNYDYGEHSHIKEVEAVNKHGKSLGKLKFTYGKDPSGDKVIYVASETQQLGRYQFKYLKGRDHTKNLYLIDAIRQQGPRVSYSYKESKKLPVLKVTKKEFPDHRFQEIEYYHTGKNDAGGEIVKIKSKKDFRNERVMLQKAPVGHDATPIITHRYMYSIAKDENHILRRKADVYNALNQLTTYQWSSSKRLEAVIKNIGSKDYRPYSIERLYWGQENYDECTLLKARSCEDASGNVHFVRSFEYDEAGNVLTDALWGNLTGKNAVPCKAPLRGVACDDGCESYVTTFTYNDHRPHLVTSCKKDDNTQNFFYAEGTDLLTAKLYTCGGKIYKREFYEYNDDAVVIKEIEDNGTTADKGNLQGVTERRIKYIQVSEHSPVGLPLVVHETYNSLDGNGDILHRKTVNRYDSLGHVLQRDLYDKNDSYLCSLYWEYDAMGNVTTEIDSMGNTIRRRYDDNNNKIYERGLDKRFYTEYAYDFSNRLIQVKEIHQDGIELTQNFKYNTLSQKIASIDIYGNETRYVYDDLGRLIQTVYPQVYNEDGQLVHPTESKEYDIFNQVTATTNARGFTTRQENTIRGTPFLISHPDGSFERFEYNLNGTVHKQVDKNLCATVFTYDKLQRPIKKTILSPEGIELSSTSCRYTTFHKISETDALGYKTRYHYDRAGKLIEMLKGKSRTSFEYDSIGRLYKTTEWDENGSSQVKVQAFDLLDRVIEERTEDSEGQVLTKATYTYDATGKRTSTSSYGESKPAVTRTYYDSRGLPCKLVDAMGQVTHIIYRYDYYNEEGQKVPYSETIDPLGNVSITIKDALGRVVKAVKKNNLGEITQESRIFYDACNNKCRQVDTLINTNSNQYNKVTTEWSYDSMNRLIATTEAKGRTKQKVTRIAYNLFGQKESVIKPDGVVLRYSYDLLGRLKNYKSSDKTIWYRYYYDANNNLLCVKDHVFSKQTLMSYDSNNRLVEEKLANGLKVRYDYDDTSKPTQITLPDQSGIAYSYQGARLKKVKRLSKEGQELYSHSYDHFDLTGKILASTLIKNCGQASFKYDPLGRETQASYPHYQESIRYDSVGNMATKTLSDVAGELACSYAYDDLYQLTNEKSFVEHTYQCDSLYNRRAKNGQKHVLNALNELISDGDFTYDYDSNGNLIKKSNANKILEFKYDALDRLTEVICGTERTHYTYDAQNRRLSKTIKAKAPYEDTREDTHKDTWDTISTVNYLYLGQNEIGAYDTSGKALQLRLLGTGKGAEIGATVAIELQEKLLAPVCDSCGNIVALLDADTGALEEAYRYTAFGEKVHFNSDGHEVASALCPWLFSSKRYDEETGLIYFGRRYYDAVTSRWLTPDPIGFDGGPNLYAYVSNNPLTHVDHYGLFAVGCDFGAWNNYASYGMNLLTSLIFMPGRILEFAGRHIVPIPLVRDVLEIGGRILAGRGLKDYTWRRDWCCYGHLGLPELIPGEFILHSDGMATSKADMIKRCQEISASMGGNNVHYYYNSTHGIAYDLMESACQMLGIRTDCSNGFYQCAKKMLSLIDGVEGGKLHFLVHSQASLYTNTLQYKISSEACKKIDVYTFGAAKLITNSRYNLARNFVSNNDGVPLFCNLIKYMEARMRPTEEIIFLDSDTFPLIDHAWDGATYQGAIKQTLYNIKNNTRPAAI